MSLTKDAIGKLKHINLVPTYEIKAWILDVHLEFFMFQTDTYKKLSIKRYLLLQDI